MSTTSATAQRDRTERQPAERRERLEARVTPELKALLQRAAVLEGRTVTDFLVSSVQAAALETTHRHEVITLTVRDHAIFIEALLNPPEPNEQLRQAARYHRELIAE